MTPHPDFAELFAVLNDPESPARVAWKGDVFRATTPRWMSRPYRLTGVGALLSGGRWNTRQLIPVVNFGTTAEVTFAEADSRNRRAGWTGPILPQTRVAFQVKLHALLDLTDPAVLKTLGVKRADLLQCEWQTEQNAGREPLTQALSRAAFETLGEGLIVPSARLINGVNLVVFPAHLHPASTLTVHAESHIPFVHGI